MKKNCYFFIILATCWVSVSYGQTADTYESNIVPVSPEAAALSKMIEYPINYNTGVPNISIPFYEVRSGNLTLPIDFIYHAGGFKINEQATAAGMGWSLSCDLQITRSVNGNDDFDDLTGYYYLNKNTFNNGDKYYFATGGLDGAPDKFYYKLLNKSGSFYFYRLNGQMHTICEPYENIKIEFEYPYFTITDTDGTVYTFGNGVNSIESSYVYGEQTPDVITAWKCTKIENFNGSHTIEFDYIPRQYDYNICNLQDRITYWSYDRLGQKVDLSSPFLTRDTYTVYELMQKGITVDKVTPRYEVVYSGYNTYVYLPYIDQSTDSVKQKKIRMTNINNHERNYKTTAMRTLLLWNITFDGGNVYFLYQHQVEHDEKNHRPNIYEITVYKNNGPQKQPTEIKRAKLIQTYESFADTYPKIQHASYVGTNYLDALHIGKGNDVFERYAFTYNDKTVFGGNRKGSDRWGYGNGAANHAEKTSLPEITETMTFPLGTSYSYTRDIHLIGSGTIDNPTASHLPYTRSGVLSRIDYPTGGRVVFDYELNKSKRNETSTDDGAIEGGGLRINSITYYDGPNNSSIALKKHYKYGVGENGIGITGDATYLSYVSDTQPYTYSHTIEGQTTEGAMNMEVKTYLPTTALEWNHANGSPVYYTTVAEYRSDSGSMSGKTIYKYYKDLEPNSPSDGRFSLYNGTPIRELNPSWGLGHLRSVSDYEYKEGDFELVREKKYEYEVYVSNYSPRVIRSYITSRTINGDGEDYGNYVYDFGTRNLSIGNILPKKETETWYYDSGNIVQTTDYEYGNLYDGKLQPTKIKTLKSDGEQLTETLEYPYSSTYAAQAPYTAMVAGNNIEPVITKKTSVNNTTLYTTNTQFALFSGTNILPSAIRQSYGNNGAFTTEIAYTRYDSKGNLLETTDKSGISTCYIWGYGGLYPVAEIKNATYQEAETALPYGFISRITDAPTPSSNDIDTLNALRNNLPDTSITTYTYKPMVGVTSITDPSGKTAVYEYDAFNRLYKISDDKNSPVQEFQYNYK